MAYGDFKDLTSRIASDKILCGDTFNIAKKPKYDGYHCGIAPMVYNFLDKKTSGRTVENKNIFNKELAEELHKTGIRKFKKEKIHSTIIDNIWGAHLVDMQLLRKFDIGFRFKLCVIDIYSKYPWIIPLKDKKRITITNDFQKILDESKLKPNKVWVDNLKIRI